MNCLKRSEVWWVTRATVETKTQSLDTLYLVSERFLVKQMLYMFLQMVTSKLNSYIAHGIVIGHFSSLLLKWPIRCWCLHLIFESYFAEYNFHTFYVPLLCGQITEFRIVKLGVQTMSRSTQKDFQVYWDSKTFSWSRLWLLLCNSD